VAAIRIEEINENMFFVVYIIRLVTAIAMEEMETYK
jgi:hypothetical protein